MSDSKESRLHARVPGERLIEEPQRLKRDLPEAVKTLIGARTGDAIYVVGPDYTIVHWDERMESLSGVLCEEALGKPCYKAVVGEAEGGTYPYRVA